MSAASIASESWPAEQERQRATEAEQRAARLRELGTDPNE